MTRGRRCRSRRNRPCDPSCPRPRRRRGRFVLVPLTSARRDPRQLHHRATGHPAERQAHGRARCAHRRAALRAPRHARRRVYAIRVQVDELPAHARDQREEYREDVGYLSGASFVSFFFFFFWHLTDDGWAILQAEGPDAFSQFHLYVCSAFLVRWSEKLREMDFQVRRSSSHRAKPNPVSHVAALLSNPTRASLCSCSRCRHKIGRTTKSRCSSAKRSCSIRSGTTRRATSLESEIESVFHLA